VTVRSYARPVDDRATTSCALYLQRDFLSDLEGAHSNVRPDRGDELAGVVCQRLDRLRDDTRNRAAPSCVYRCDISARGMSDQHWDAVRRSGRNRDASDPHDECIPLGVHYRHRVIGRLDLTD
jgi:hypothetical protein